MRLDYHIHTAYSKDAKATPREQLDAARRAGLTHIAITDHVDFDDSTMPPADIATRNAEIVALAPLYPELDIALGAEIGMKNRAAYEKAAAYLKDCRLDFIIGSVHIVDGVDAYYPEYFAGKTQDVIIGRYLETLLEGVNSTDFSSMGHYDFCVKYSPLPNRSISLPDRPEVFDAIFRSLITTGRCMEVNTSAWRDDPAWGLDILKRYHQLGGEFVTVGSDAHTSDRVYRRIDEAVELISAAGIKYIASFRGMTPCMHRII